jgi:hypothetical protein
VGGGVGAAPATGTTAIKSTATIKDTFNNFAFITTILLYLVLTWAYQIFHLTTTDISFHITYGITNTSLKRQPPNKKIGGLAVCQSVRISLADP